MKWISIFVLMIITLLKANQDTSKSNKIISTTPIKGAVWVGGSDGGCWMKIDSINDETVYAEIFYENKQLWVKGKFKLNKGNYTFNDIKNKLDGYDGENIHLQYDNVFLKPVDVIEDGMK